ncbi:serine/threonine-protein phosphatase 6 regulatory ankyrin repeat subunit A-like isoform X2 [Bacillus rossius redtenbacheri]|uniref:serine/threonine-protein phosphatase 6 regulatory ankyrin repeat subunit A-like isoform X2 n=1 Tax=Bacillus rossius redtenbacheri TaxID=93214 RepID=UPI002FDCF2B5
MASHTAPNILIVLLMTVGAALAASILDPVLPEDVREAGVVSAMIKLNRTTKMFGNTYQQALLLYKDHSEDIRKLADLVNELKNEIRGKTQNNEDVKELLEENAILKRRLANISKELSHQKEKCNRTLELLTQQLNVKNLVADYNLTKNWRKLRSGLGDVLDHSSPAFSQLMAVSESEEYAPWQIGYDGHRELTAVLVYAGRGLNMVDGSGDNLLHGSVAGGQLPLVEELLDAGAGIESRNSWGNAPLALACKYRRLEVARYLWRRGADVDGINYDERWAGLARAADKGYLEIARFMVEEAGANTTLKDREGLTPLELARRNGHNDVVEYLSQYPH